MAKKVSGAEDRIVELEGNASLWKALLGGAPIGISLIDSEYRIQYANPVLAGWLGEAPQEILGKKCHEILFGSQHPCEDGRTTCPAKTVLASAAVTGPATFGRKAEGGGKQYFQVHAHPVLDDAGTPLYALEFIQEVTCERLLADYKEEAALRDPLSGLYNRQGFNLLLGRELKRTRRQGHPLSLCVIDLDSFKDYNEKKGEEAGDRLLEQLASILAAQTRVEVDSLARLQADTFALILPEVTREQALGIGRRVRRATQEALPAISFSMAICEPERDEDEDAFSHRTMDVLFQAKKAGGNKIL